MNVLASPTVRRLGLALPFIILGSWAAAVSLGQPRANNPQPPAHDRPAGNLELVATFPGPMPTGVTVSHGGRIFVNFPRWGDPVEFTVAELKNGQPTPYPDAEINRIDTGKAAERFVSVQSVVVGPDDRLWVLDTGSVEFKPAVPGGPKLVGIDLSSNRVVQTIHFPPDVALPTTYLNDVRFDLRRGERGMAFITDSSDKGPNGIIVVDLGTGKSWRRLNDHPSTKAEKGFLPLVEGRPVMVREPGKPPQPLAMGSDGIALDCDGHYLYYCPLAGRHLYRVDTAALIDPTIPEAEVAKSVEDLGEKGASDGLEADSEGRIYLTEYETNGILRRLPEGQFETLVHDPRVLWPDTLSLAADGYLYFTANQLHRQARFHDGKDLREKPYALFRVRVDGKPVELRK